MNHYFIDYPRGFGNEYTVYVTDNAEEEARLRKYLPNVTRITRKSAIYHGTSRPYEAKRTGQQHFGGWCHTPDSWGVGWDAIGRAVVGTSAYLDELEQLKWEAENLLDGATGYLDEPEEEWEEL